MGTADQNQAHVRKLLRQREPQMAAAIKAGTWTAGMLDGYVARTFGPGADAARIWCADALAAGFTVAVYKSRDGRIDLFPYSRGARLHAAVPCSAGGLLTLAAVCRPDENSNVVPLPRAAGTGRK